ncbi:putative class 1 integrase [Escherichia coli 3-073-06_S3_C1]|nr:putative class 1 integrase [Escherichia coli 2-011-08_S3_C2]KDW69959.1 putative class 1 integrase [Escherichia coli 2-005-03_S4_C1]KDY82229.1 putative class 1 integrase [Escherichia coli 2-474-04_S3_C1]KDY83867.1 putative class 1 integrase [Escherichia coli 2-474-04_S3_C2]KDZ07519.1 putative class 1 integrase [Escherichia coli 2-474-04_S3_C3]KDZ56824.1 putative class 1 integrase [Escherichia coli 3-073-06_S3_C1]KDZ57144.1 putative class 1 integrase [Escherichia coli 3-073-06_S3_C2]
MPAFEWVHVQLHQQKGMISLSPPTICNSAPASAATAEVFRSPEARADPCTAPCRRRTARPPMPDDAWRPKPCARSPARTEMPRLRCCPRLPGDAHRGNG